MWSNDLLRWLRRIYLNGGVNEGVILVSELEIQDLIDHLNKLNGTIERIQNRPKDM